MHACSRIDAKMIKDVTRIKLEQRWLVYQSCKDITSQEAGGSKFRKKQTYFCCWNYYTSKLQNVDFCKLWYDEAVAKSLCLFGIGLYSSTSLTSTLVRFIYTQPHTFAPFVFFFSTYVGAGSSSWNHTDMCLNVQHEASKPKISIRTESCS